MKKYLYKIIIGVLFLGAAAAGIVFSILYPVEKQAEETEVYNLGEIFFQPENYKADENVEILINTGNYLHYDETTIRGILKEIAYKEQDEKIDKFIIQAPDETLYEIEYDKLDLISTDVQTDEEGEMKAEMVFRTGGRAELTVGKEAMLYKTEDNLWSLDSREHMQSSREQFSGKIVDFVFLPISNMEDEIYLSYIVVENDEGEEVRLYASSIYGASIKSLNEINIYYAGSTSDTQVFDVEEGEKYKIELQTRDKTYTLKKGSQIDLVQSENYGYWQLYEEVNTSIQKAEVEGFTFGYYEDNIVSLDYINMVLKSGEKVQMTMSQTGAIYAIPYGDYTKTYTYFAHEKVLTAIDGNEGWMIELYFEDDIMLEMEAGSEAWVSQNEYGIWQLEYKHMAEEEDETAEG